jgi:hypothetical protein
LNTFQRLEAYPSLLHVEDKIEARCEAVWGFRYSHHQVAAEQAIALVGRLIGKIELRRKHRSFWSLHFDVIVTGAARIDRGHDGAETIATLIIGKDVSAIAEAGVVVFPVLIGMPEVDKRSVDRTARALISTSRALVSGSTRSARWGELGLK